MTIRALLGFAILLGTPPGSARAQPVAADVGPWVLTCFRDGQLAGRAFETCRAEALPGVSIERDAQGLVGVVTGCKTQAKGVFRLSPRGLADLTKRAGRLDKAVAEALRQCGLPPLAAATGATERLLQASDGLSADWVG